MVYQSKTSSSTLSEAEAAQTWREKFMNSDVGQESPPFIRNVLGSAINALAADVPSSLICGAIDHLVTQSDTGTGNTTGTPYST